MKTPEMRGRIIGDEEQRDKMAQGDDLLLRFGVASGVAVAIGAVICVVAGAPTSAWVLTVVAWFLGASLAWGLSHAVPSGAVLGVTVAVGIAACTLTLILGPDQDGVRRWLDIGPLTLNVALLTLPPMIVALALSGGWLWVVAPVAAVLLALQPDASQATALACAVGVAALLSPRRRGVVGACWAATAVVAAIAWTRPDPLMPVAHVEQIVTLAWSVLPPLAVAAVAASVAVVASIVMRVGTVRAGRAAAAALATWTAVSMLAPAFGAFPQPLVGAGAAPVLGLWLATGILAGVRRAQTLERRAA